MGSIVSITIGSYDFLSYKNTFGDLLTIFNPEDQYTDEIECNDEKNIKYSFITTVERAKQCLDCLGYTIERAKKTFEYSKTADVTDYNNFSKEDFGEGLEKEFTFESWCKAAQYFAVLLSQDTFDHSSCSYVNLEKQRPIMHSISEKFVLESLPFNDSEHFFGISIEYYSWDIFRVLLDAFPAEQKIILDYTDLYNGGWCPEKPDNKFFETDKTVVLTEGKFDTEVISKSMQILYPHMCKFYSFMDFSATNVQGSTSFLTHYLKAFIGAGIKNRIIALYDNDAAGVCEIENLKKLKLPENIRVITLPMIEMAKNYPTIGPTSNECVDINGKACSIELFLGKDVLMDSGKLIPIMWHSYIEKVKIYQGEIMHKGDIQQKFKEKLSIYRKNDIQDLNNWNEMNILLNKIFSVFN